MFNAIRTALTGLVLFGLLGSAGTADAQMWKKVKERAKKAAEREVLNEVDRKVTNTVRCTLGDQSCLEQAASEGKEVEVVDENGNVVAATEAGSAAGDASAAPGGGVWANYDFTPGERILFASDFGSERVGNFPSRFEFVSGNAEVVELDGKRYLRASAPTVFRIPLPEQLPEQFTVEFDYQQEYGHLVSTVLTEAWDLAPSGSGYRSHYTHSMIALGNATGLAHNDGPSSTTNTQRTQKMQPIRLQVDGQYGKLYVGEERVANLPNTDLPRGRALTVLLYGQDGRPGYFGDVRVAAGGIDLYQKLSTEGRVATQGIYFDTGSDRIRPESTPTLNEIGSMLNEHSDLRLAIEGHTDNVGDDAANQSLSEKRAAAVRQHLVSSYGIDGSRLEAKGIGENNPIADNGTAEGRQQNRRVELVKM